MPTTANGTSKGKTDSSATDEGIDPKITSDLAAHLVSTLNAQLSAPSASRPSFLGPITVAAFEFGQRGPEVEITDVRDVWRAFDAGDEGGEEEEDEEDGYEDEYGYGEEYGYEGEYYGNGYAHDGLSPMSEEVYEYMDDEYGEADDVEAESVFSGMSPRKMGIGDVGMGFGLQRLSSMSASLSMPSIAQASQVGMGMGGARDRRSHANGHDYTARRKVSGQSRSGHSEHNPHFSRPRYTNTPRRASRTLTQTQTQTLSHTPGNVTSPPLSPPFPPRPLARRATSTSSNNPIPSLQLHLRLSHLSDLSLTLQTSLQVNYPSPGFMALPLRLCVTGLRIEADVVLAYSNVKGRGRVHVCIVDQGPGEGENAAAMGLAQGQGQGHSHTYGQEIDQGPGQRILPEIHIESEIGHADVHVLRNVGKVERFIADAVRKIIVDELVFPNFHTIAL